VQSDSLIEAVFLLFFKDYFRDSPLLRKVGIIMKKQESYVRITSAGTITIPAHLRRKHFIKRGDVYQLSADEGEISLVRVINKCLYCGADESHVDLISVCGKMMCPDCMAELAQELKEKKPRKKRNFSKSVSSGNGVSKAAYSVSAKSN